MSAKQIKSLLNAPDWDASNKQTIEFLNQSLSTYESLGQLETLLQQAQIRHEELQTQLSSSGELTRILIANTRNSVQEHIVNSQELSLIRHSLADELSELSNELISALSDEVKQPTLLEDTETLHRSLKELESIKGYIQVIHHGLKVSESAVAQVKSTTILSPSSVTVFQELQKFVDKVTTTCINVEHYNGQQKLHIVEFLEKLRDKTWSDIKGVLANALTVEAEKLGWPMSMNYVAAAPDDRKAFEASFVNMLRLQTIGKGMGADYGINRSESDGLYPVQALVIPVSLRFKYHFEGNRQTNRLDKPEWYFTHILNVAHEHLQFMNTVIQPLLSNSEYKEFHAWLKREFALLLLPLLSRKLRKTIPVLLSRPSVLAHTIHQALSFDTSFIEEGFQLQGTSAAALDDEGAKWDGITNVILGNQDWFQAWLSGEQKFVEDQYQHIIEDSDAWVISDDTGGDLLATSLKSTNSARRIKALFDQVTDRYSPLPNSSQRIQFLTSIQLPILHSYLTRIASSLDAFETLSSAFVRAVPGGLGLGSKVEGTVNINTQKLTGGAEGIQRLCKALLSTAHIELALESWSEDLFFLELWSDVHHNQALRECAEANDLLPSPGSEDTDVPHDTIFEVFINKYTSLVVRAEHMIVQQVCSEVEAKLKSHFASARPDSSTSPIGQPSTEEPLVSQTLLAPLAVLSSHLAFLLLTLSQTSFTALYRQIASRLTEHILHRQVLFRGSFNAAEGRRILAECQLWVETCQVVLTGNGSGNTRALSGGRARVDAPWAKLLQAGRLAAAEGDVWKRVVENTFGGLGQERWKDLMHDVTGFSELSREVVGSILRRRDDCLS